MVGPIRCVWVNVRGLTAHTTRMYVHQNFNLTLHVGGRVVAGEAIKGGQEANEVHIAHGAVLMMFCMVLYR